MSSETAQLIPNMRGAFVVFPVDRVTQFVAQWIGGLRVVGCSGLAGKRAQHGAQIVGGPHLFKLKGGAVDLLQALDRGYCVLKDTLGIALKRTVLNSHGPGGGMHAENVGTKL